MFKCHLQMDASNKLHSACWQSKEVSVIIFSGIYVELRVGDLTDAKQTQLTLGIQK